MGKLITLDEYYNHLGTELFPDWSEEAINYLRDRTHRERFKRFKNQALKTQKLALSKILKDGKIKVCLRKEQGYIDPPFILNDFNFPRSMCSNNRGEYYPCKIETKIETRGRKKSYAGLEKLISKYVTASYLSKGLREEDIKAAAVIDYIRAFLNKAAPSPNTIRSRLLKLYPKCAKITRNSKK